MTASLRGWAVPAFLFLCLLVGGSSALAWPSSILQMLGVLLIAWAAVTPRSEPAATASRYLIALTATGLCIVLLQLVPLPPALWSSLPGRDVLEAGYRSLGLPLPWHPVSLSPHRSLESAYWLVPPLAAALGILAVQAHSEKGIAGAVLLGALASVTLAALQIASGGPPAWPYLYEVTSVGAVGFFANRNHMATLLLAAIPFAAALLAAAHPQVRRRTTAVVMVAIAAGSFLLIVVGLVLNWSMAALLLAVPVIAFSTLLLPFGWRLRRIIVPLAAIAFLASVGALASTSIRTEIAGSPEIGSIYSRAHIWSVTFDAVANFFPFGTGLGTFRNVYVLWENPALVDPNYVNHAHNDYLELVLETGLAGVVLLAAFLAWYGWQTVRVWTSPFSSLFAKAASIASAAILAHSIVDYPLRTAAIAALFGACLALMAQSLRQTRSEEARHVRIA